MKKIILFSVICFCCTGLYAGARARVGVEVNAPASPYYGYQNYDDQVYWNGPGMYYGVWVGNDIEFYNRRRHHHRYRRNHRRYHHSHGNHHHSHPHSGPHHHGGGHRHH